MCISIDPLTQPQERLTGVKFGQEIHRERVVHSLHCVNDDCRDKQLNLGLKTCRGKRNVALQMSTYMQNCIYNV